jgi:hypothetical protein
MERKKSAFDGRDRMITVHRTRKCGAHLAGARTGRQSRAPTNLHGEARRVVLVYADFSLRGGAALLRLMARPLPPESRLRHSVTTPHTTDSARC